MRESSIRKATWGRFQIRSRVVLFFLTIATLALISAAFWQPFFWPLAYVCLVPWVVGACTAITSRWVYLSSWLLGVAFFAINASWLFDVTAPGYVALCLWFALAFPLTVWPVRHLFRRYSAPVTLTFPIAWATFEFFRGQTLTGFPWLYLAQTHATVTTMIQIADLAGAYGVGFVIAMVNGFLTDLMIQPVAGTARRRGVRVLVASAGLTLIAITATVVYGVQRVRELETTRMPGPRVAVIQQDFPNYVDPTVNQVDPFVSLEAHLCLARRAAKEHPDIIVMPETACPWPLNREFLNAHDLEPIRTRVCPPDWTDADMQDYHRRCLEADEAIRHLSATTGAAVVIGASAIEWRPAEIPERAKRFNSVYVYPPGGGPYTDRYDKVHLVLFGEFIPFRYTSLHTVYQWLNRCMPWGATGKEYSLDFGESFKRFQTSVRSQAGRSYRFATPVCYEDVVTDVIREFADAGRDEKQIDFLLSVSNDGWFNHSAELEQHLSASLFRAVEYRVPIARAVNTGISIFIDPVGRATQRVELSAEQMERLAGVQTALQQIQPLVESARRKAEGSTDARAISASDIAPILSIVRGTLSEGLSGLAERSPATAPSTQPHMRVEAVDLANEFDFLRARLEEMVRRAAYARPTARAAAWSALRDQVAADVDTVDRWRKLGQTAPGYRVSELVCDSRQTLYSQWGDWFSLGCAGLTGVMLLDWLVRRLQRPSRRRRRALARQKEAAA